MINVFQPSLGEEEVEALRRVLLSNWTGRGKVTEQFESALARFLLISRGQLTTTTCCTEALFQIFEHLKVGPGDQVVLPSISFVGAGNAIASTGAEPVFCDVDPHTLNATAEFIERKITPRTKAVMILHYGGDPAEVDPILKLLAERNIPLVEDSACSVASLYKGRACGTLGDFGAWSFDSMKILVAGDGGALYARDPAVMGMLSDRLYLGMGTKSGFSVAPDQKRWWEFEITSFGRRAIVNDMTAAVAMVQLGKLNGFIERRCAIRERYDRAFDGLGWLTAPPRVPEDCKSSHYLYWVQVSAAVRDGLAQHLKTRGIYTTFRYHPLHRVRLYNSKEKLPNADSVAERTLCLPIHQGLSDSDVERVIEGVLSFE